MCETMTESMTTEMITETDSAGTSSVLVQSSVDHSTDHISQVRIEQLEMMRLGLPISFGTSRPRKTKRRHNNNNPNYPAPKFNDRWVVEEMKEAEEATGVDVELQLPVNDEDAIDDDDDDDDEDTVEEVLSIKLNHDSFDFLEQLEDLQNLTISKRAHPTDDEATTTGSEMSTTNDQTSTKPPVRKKKKKSKKSPKDRTFPYWRQRFVLFSRFSDGIKLDRESWYSVTPEPIARHIAGRIERALVKREDGTIVSKKNKFIILDGFCGAGGNTIQFALLPTTALVYAVDIDPAKIELARHNATIYGCVDKIQFIVADFFEVIRSRRLPLSLVDVCFLSPPWGGPDYNRFPTYSLTQMTPNGFDIARLVSGAVTRNISFLLPRNFDMAELAPLSKIVYECDQIGETETELKVEIEKNLLYKKVKTMTAYFGDLVNNDRNNNQVELPMEEEEEIEEEEEEEKESEIN